MDAETADDVDATSAGHVWAAIGNLSFEAGDWSGSIEANGRAVEAFTAAGNSVLAAWSTYLQVHSHWGAGNLEDVDRLVEEVVERFRTAGDDMGLGYALWVAGQRVADRRRAEELAAEADEKLRRMGVPNGIAHDVEGRGIIALEEGRRADAGGEPDLSVVAQQACAALLGGERPPRPAAVRLT